ncbi:MAG: hypothetical protein HC930_18100 [Hydrococcus sp. SU_1_0]|nr:hypothetical protein [Hydrococcus sp. SU_1_0]
MSANSKLGEQLPALQGQKFTGVLTITTQNDQQQWKLFSIRESICGQRVDIIPIVLWRRNFRRYCPGVNQESIVLRNQSEMRSRPYCLLHVLLQRKIIQREQVKALIENHAREVCFDLLQKEYGTTLKYTIENTSAHYLLKEGFSLSLISIDLGQILLKSQREWSTWGSKGLASCSPHHAPLLHRYQDLQQHLPDFIFANMSRLLNGKRTLRDLAVVMDKNLLDLTCGIIPYFFKGYLRLLEIADLADAQAEK